MFTQFRETAVSAGGALLEVEVTYPPQSSLPPAHYHPSQEERFEVKARIIRAIIEGQEKEFKAGDEIIVPPGTIHQIQNVALEPAQVIWQTRPALRAVEGNPRNAEIQLAMSSEEDAGRLQKAFLDAGGQVEDPAEVLMFEPVKIYPLVDPFGTNLLLSSGILTTTCRIIGILASHIRLETNSIW